MEDGFRGSNVSGKSQFSIKTRKHREYIDSHIENIGDFADYGPQLPETSMEGFWKLGRMRCDQRRGHTILQTLQSGW